MYIYDKAHELAAEIKKSPEFLEYKKGRRRFYLASSPAKSFWTS